MTDDDLAERLRAVERAVTDGDTPVRELSDSAAVHDRLDDLEADLAELGERVDALDATVQSLHGYVGELEHVNDRVQRRADAARAAVERLEDEQAATGSRSALSGRDCDSDTDEQPSGGHSSDEQGTPASDVRDSAEKSHASDATGVGDALGAVDFDDSGQPQPRDTSGSQRRGADQPRQLDTDQRRSRDGLQSRRREPAKSRDSTDDASLLDRVRESL